MVMVFLEGRLLVPIRDYEFAYDDEAPTLHLSACSGNEVHVVRLESEAGQGWGQRFYRVVPPNSDSKDYAGAHSGFMSGRRGIPPGMFSLVEFTDAVAS